jgi:glycerol-3-phosphate O-acyltransferase
MLQNLKRDRETIITEVTSRMREEVERGKDNLLELINGTLYLERERLRKYSHLYKHPERDRAFYRGLSRNLAALSDGQLKIVLDRLVQHYVEEITGNFNSAMYRVATAVIPRGLSLMLNTLSPSRILKNFPEIPSIDNTVILSGPVDKIRRLKDGGGVLVYVPVHQSNLDSPVLGYGIYRSCLPPVMYGAGLNLFQMPVFPFFMGRLGAYTVDRLKKSDLYKRILKQYAAVTLEMGYDHLFFPGGTRSRSGLVETRLKKGLLGTALKAFVSSRMKGRDTRFFIVPITVSYHLVLEAPTLVADHLVETGRSRYIIIDDESSKPGVVFDFMQRIFSMQARIYFNFCEPMDPFGNAVSDEGLSIDGQGRVIDIDGYITRGGEIRADDQRDQVYTNETAQRIVDSYLANTCILTTQAAAHVLFTALRRKCRAGDLFKFLREDALTCSVTVDEAAGELERLAARLLVLEQEGRIRMEPLMKSASGLDVLMNAVKYFGVFDRDPVIYRQGNRLFTRDPNLLYYYSNRLSSYGPEAVNGPEAVHGPEAVNGPEAVHGPEVPA